MSALAVAEPEEVESPVGDDDEPSYYEADCPHCEVVHPCKNLGGEICFSPPWSIECPLRGTPAKGARWTGAD